MAISDKIGRIYDTKKEIAKAIQEKGVKVYDEDTFRSYAEKIRSLNSDDYDENGDHPDLNDPSAGDGTGGGDGTGDGDGTAAVKYKSVKKTITKNGTHYADGTYEPLTEEDKKKIDNQNKWDHSTSPQYKKLSEDAEAKNKEIQDAEAERDKLQQQADGMSDGQEKARILNLINEKTGIIDELRSGYDAIQNQMTSAATAATNSGTITQDVDEDDEEFNTRIEQLTDDMNEAHTDSEREYYQKQIDDLTEQHRKEKGLDTTNTNAETIYYFSEVKIAVTEDSGDEFTVSFWNDSEQLVMGKDGSGNDIKEITVPRGGSTLYAGDIPDSPDPDKYFTGWNPKPVNVQSNLRCYAQFSNANMGYTKLAQYSEIKDSWEKIVENKGAGYDVGQWKILPLPNNLKFQINDQTGYLPDPNQGVMMMKVLGGEGDSTSTWLAVNPIKVGTGTQASGDGSWGNYPTSRLNNQDNYANLDDVYLNAPIAWTGTIYRTTSYTDRWTRTDMGSDISGYSKYEDYLWGGSKCYLYEWLNDEFLKKLPEVIRENIVSVEKKTPFYLPKSKAALVSDGPNTASMSVDHYEFEQGDKPSTFGVKSKIWVPSIYEIFGDSMKTPYNHDAYAGKKYSDNDGNNFIEEGGVTYDIFKTGERLNQVSANYDTHWNTETAIKKIPFGYFLSNFNGGPQYAMYNDFPLFTQEEGTQYYPGPQLCFTRNVTAYGHSISQDGVKKIEADTYGWAFGYGSYYESMYDGRGSHDGIGFFPFSMDQGAGYHIIFGFCL